MKFSEFTTEAVRQRLDPHCWKRKHKEGTKIKGGVRVDKDWIPVVLMGGFAEVENDELTILVNGAEEGSKIDKDEAQKNLEEMTVRFNEATTSKEKIEATQNLRKARARVQASTL